MTPREAASPLPDPFVLLSCAYDIRPIFEAGPGQVVPAKRETRLAVGLPPGTDHPQVFEIPRVISDLLVALDDWTDPLMLDVVPQSASSLPISSSTG